MKNNNYMTWEQAEMIKAYNMPENREGYLTIVNMIGYTKLRGAAKASEAPTYQLRVVAHKIRQDAGRIISSEREKEYHFWKSIDEQIMMEDALLHELQFGCPKD